MNKWIIGDERRFGPFEAAVVLIRNPFISVKGEENWYFAFSEHKAYPQSRVFDTAQQAALAQIAANNVKISHLQMETGRLQEWYDDMEAKRKTDEAESARLAAQKE